MASMIRGDANPSPPTGGCTPTNAVLRSWGFPMFSPKYSNAVGTVLAGSMTGFSIICRILK